MIIDIPDFEVTNFNGLDFVEIPDGHIWSEGLELQVPFYSKIIDYPKGYEIQSVTLLKKSEIITKTGLNIPMTPQILTPGTRNAIPYSGPVEDWFPQKQYDWNTIENPDGTVSLIIKMYPFYYNPLTTNIKFYKNYNFNIEYSISSVSIINPKTNKSIYSMGDTVLVDFGINNAIDSGNVIVSTLIKQYGTSKTVDGLPLQTLNNLANISSFSQHWNSFGFEPGYYFIEIILKDLEGTMLDRKTISFRLGIPHGEITEFSITSDFFLPGDSIGISSIFRNDGEVNLTGNLYIIVKSKDETTTKKFSHNFTNLSPGRIINTTDVLKTTDEDHGSIKIIAYVLYNNVCTEPIIHEISSVKN